MKTDNQAKFHSALVAAYTDLFANSPEYAYAASKGTPDQLADKMLNAALTGSINKDGEGIKRACKACGIPYTYKAIFAFVGKPEDKPAESPAKENTGIGNGKFERTVLSNVEAMMTGCSFIDRQRNVVRLTYTDGTTERTEISETRWQEIKSNPFAIVGDVQSKRAMAS